MKMRIRRFALSCVAMLTAMALFTVSSLYDGGLIYLRADAKDSVADLQKEYDELEDQLKALKKDLNKMKDTESSYLSMVSNYNEQIELVRDQIDSVGEQIKLLGDNIDEMDEQIADLEVEIGELNVSVADNYEKFKERLRAFHLTGEANELEILFGSASFADFLNRYAVVRAVAERDKALMNALSDEIDAQKAVLAQTEDLKTSVEAEREGARKLQNDLKKKQSELDNMLSETEKLLSDIRSDEKKTQSAINEINKDMEEVEREILEATRNSTGEYAGGEFLWPAPSYTYISSPFGYRTHPVTGVKHSLHTGVDLPSPKNSPILAANAGKVTTAYNTVHGGYGKYVIIDHGGGVVTLYGHCNEVLVKVGDTVERGQQIAKVGTTGNSTGYHLHFEIRINGEYIDPMTYFPDRK